MHSVGALGFTSFKELNQLNEGLGVNIVHKLVLISHVKSVVIWVLRRIKIPMIILYEFIVLMKLIRIKMVAFDAEVPFDRFSKELALSVLVLATLFAWCKVG